LVESAKSNIKISFFNEILSNPKKSLKHYMIAYSNLQELVGTKDAQVNEIRVLSDYMNLKIYLSLIYDKKIDIGVKTFITHIDW
jgi:hypothetical protein